MHRLLLPALCATALFAPALTGRGPGMASAQDAAVASPQPPPQDGWARVLAEYVHEGRVDYARLKATPAALDAYLNHLASLTPSEFNQRPENERLALLLNLYNAATLRLIADHYPVTSIRSIGQPPGSAWKQKSVRWLGRRISLDELEHQLIRPKYTDARVHFALVCAAQGCPPLRSEPYSADRLQEQLHDQALGFLSDPRKNRFDAATGTLWLSPLFEWYLGDFATNRTELARRLTPYLDATTRRQLEAATSVTVRFTEYDWSLNDRSAP